MASAGHWSTRSILPRLVATDLDGTLIGADGVVSPHSAAALRRMAAAGAVVVLVTGRCQGRLASVYEQLGARYLTVCANGAVEFDAINDRVRVCRPLEPAHVHETCVRLRRHVPGVVFAAHVECGWQMVCEPRWPLPTSIEAVCPRVTLEELTLARQVVKLQARTAGTHSQLFTRIVGETVGDLVEVTTQGYRGLVEISGPGVTKAAALAALAERLRISPAEVLAFGDMPNDVSMLQWAGRSVAVANAHPQVHAVADESTASNLDDGVAVYLDQLLRDIA